MKKEYVEELVHITPRQRQVVLDGLKNKLGLYKRKQILSYRYDVCPICRDVKEDCDSCYITKSCKAPFNDGFRDDPEAGAKYFTEMQNLLLSTKPPSVFVAGGTWDYKGGKSSKIVELLSSELQAKTINGGHVDDGIFDSAKHCRDSDLIIWMPNIANEETKVYPKKSQGSVLICSKVMREGYKKADAVTRIFKMNANAVIEIRKEKDLFNFRLTDALGNTWVNTDKISELTKSILALYNWTKGSIRVGTVDANKSSYYSIDKLMSCVSKVADKVENNVGERYFGNVMTRCQKMFPGMRQGSFALVSPRNSDKRRLRAEDMVAVADDNPVKYWGSKKPSVDTPIQLAILRENLNINYLIHGHAYIKGSPVTKHYYPCGDLREISEVLEFTSKSSIGAINLKNHGFLLFASTISGMNDLIEKSEFVEPENFGI